MLQNDIREENDNDGFVVPKTSATEDVTVSPRSPTSPLKSRFRAGSRSVLSSNMQRSHQNFISYGEFLASYWVHLPQTFTRGLGEGTQVSSSSFLTDTDPALVFGEIMGVIKGSEEAV